MRILYVTPMWTALEEVLLGGGMICKGMPAFFRPLHQLLSDGHEIDMLIVETDPEKHLQPLCPQIDWLKKIHYYRYLQRWTFTGFRKPLSEISIIWTNYHAAKEVLATNRYDFVYGHGPNSEAAGLAAAKKEIPFGQRRYGDSIMSYIDDYSMLRAIFSRPSTIWSYRRPKTFMLATNDGSRVNEAYARINRKKQPYPLYFWRNGYNPSPKGSLTAEELLDQPYLLYIARFASWKRQDRAIELLHELKKRKHSIPLYFAGQKDDPVYFQSLMDRAAALGVAEQIHYLGSISAEKIAAYSSNALACLSFYDISNFGNVFIEYATSGGTIISLDDGSLNECIQSGENGFLVHDMENAARIVEDLLQNPKLCDQIRENVLNTSQLYFLTWDERVEKEINLITETVSHAKNQEKAF